MIYLAGKNNIAVHALEYLSNRFGSEQISVLLNKTDNGQDGWQRSLKKRAKELKIRDVRIEELRVSNNDIFISLEFDRIVKPIIFENCSAYNIHFSELPKYKGMYTSIFPILNNEKNSGVTLHRIDKGIDTGNICRQKTFEIKDSDRASDLYKKYIDNSILLFNECIDNIVDGNLNDYLQSYENSSYYAKDSLDFKSLNIPLNDTAWGIKKRIYAFSFRVYQLPIIFGKKIVEAEILPYKSTKKVGCVVQENKDWMIISTVDYDLKLYFDKLNENLPLFARCNNLQSEVYLKNICGVHDRNDRGWSPIIVASYHGNIEAIDKLLEMGADINDVNYNGTSVLMYAKDFCLKNKDAGLFKYLIHKGADIEHKDFHGKGIIDYLDDKAIGFFGL